MARPLVTVYNEKGEATPVQIKMPAVYRAPVRPDIVNFVHDQLRRNTRQAYAVSKEAGKFSWEIFFLGLINIYQLKKIVQATRPLPSRGAPDAPWRVFRASAAAARTAAARAPLATCAVADACLRPRKPTAAGIVGSTSPSNATPSARRWPLRVFPLLWWPEVYNNSVLFLN